MTVFQSTLIVFSVSMTGLLAGCGAKKGIAETAAPEPLKQNPLEITAGAELLKGIKIGKVPYADVSAAMKLAGRIEADETRMARISSPVTGRIVALEISPGQMVQRGEILARIHSTDLSAAQSALLKSSTQHQLAQKAVARARQLLEAGVIGEAELQRREAELQQLAAELATSRDQLIVLGMSAEELAKLESSRVVNSVVPIVSTIQGRVLERKITMGQVVQAAETVFVIADLSNVWLVVDVPEQNASSLRPGKKIVAEIPAVSGQPISGNLNYVNAIVNAETRTVGARMDLANSDLLYKPSMLATITLLEGAERRRVVPASAVVREDNQDNVLVRTQDSTFVLRPVTLGLEFRDVRVLETGISEGEEIVLEGAFHLNNERKRRAIQGE